MRVRKITAEVERVAAVTLRAHRLAPPVVAPAESAATFCEAAMAICRKPLVDSNRRGRPVRYDPAVLGDFNPDVGDTPESCSTWTHAKMRYVPEQGWFVDELWVEDRPPQWLSDARRPPVAAD